MDARNPVRRQREGLLTRASNVAVLLFAAAASPARAGMPVAVLQDLARLRLETISFFLVVFLVATWLVQRAWNALQKDFSGLPRLTYRRALAFVFLWGLAFNLVLTMISGARELLTPGAWARDGATYELADEQPVGRAP